MGDRGPASVCLHKAASNSSLAFHKCMCSFDYSFAKSKEKALKIKHCLEASEMYKMVSFRNYIVIAAIVIVSFVAFVAIVCSFKWYMETKKNPCTCCPLLCCCRRKRKRTGTENHAVNVFEQSESGHTWSPVNLPPNRDEENIPSTPTDDSRDPSICMNFCLSDPVQDCCEFFDCDIMWRKKSVYTIPIFGRKKQQHHLQRRPTRPAPPPPKAVVLPQIKNPEPIIGGSYEEEECEPVPEAPPSPEPIRTIPPKAMYVDPFAFLQRTFAKNVQSEKEDSDDGKQEDLYSKFKNKVLAKVKKSVSVASINKLGVSSDPSGVSNNPSGSSTKKMKTASLASLNNLGESELDTSYGSKRSLSLASLNLLQDQGIIKGTLNLDPRSRASILSTVSTATDDIPPSARTDEYIDLEEMTKRIEAKMLAAQLAISATPSTSSQPVPDVEPKPSAYTPNFIPASAFVGTPNVSSFNPNYTPIMTPEYDRNSDGGFVQENIKSPQYFPPVPASQGKPAVPARTAVGAPIYSMSPSGTLGRSKPVVPPRPPPADVSRAQTSTLPRSPRLVKPSVPPPPPPPGVKVPIESSI